MPCWVGTFILSLVLVFMVVFVKAKAKAKKARRGDERERFKMPIFSVLLRLTIPHSLAQNHAELYVVCGHTGTYVYRPIHAHYE
jgi:hypothetical protein